MTAAATATSAILKIPFRNSISCFSENSRLTPPMGEMRSSLQRLGAQDEAVLHQARGGGSGDDQHDRHEKGHCDRKGGLADDPAERDVVDRQAVRRRDERQDYVADPGRNGAAEDADQGQRHAEDEDVVDLARRRDLAPCDELRRAAVGVGSSVF
jgi:hypothetical protein